MSNNPGNKNEEEGKAPEILIIRRGGHGGEEGHHGGVWKIAYADFMTAMMAFFLVMWLINSSDKKTLTQVATYFNPLRLTDKSAASKGLHEAHSVEQTSQGDEVQSSGTTQGAKKEKGKKESKGDPKGKFSEESIFQDPLAMLDRIAADAKEANEAAKARTAVTSQPSDSTPSGSEQIRDPFDPGFRQQIEVRKSADSKPDAKPDDSKPADTKDNTNPSADNKTTPRGGIGDNPDKQGGLEGDKVGRGGIGDLADKKSGLGDADKQKQAAVLPPRKPTEKSDDAKLDEKAIAAAVAQAQRIEQELKTSVTQSLLGGVPNIEVTMTEEGILISVTDDFDFGMFAVASAEPRPQLVLVMEKLAQVLAKQPEQLVIRGHTDARPYKKGAYDNWRLSTARAHMAYYMLLRGGVDEARFEKVEGYADKRLRLPQDPSAAPNRRIEILLRRPKP